MQADRKKTGPVGAFFVQEVKGIAHILEKIIRLGEAV